MVSLLNKYKLGRNKKKDHYENHLYLKAFLEKQVAHERNGEWVVKGVTWRRDVLS